jgi:hypothetical protein
MNEETEEVKQSLQSARDDYRPDLIHCPRCGHLVSVRDPFHCAKPKENAQNCPCDLKSWLYD